MYILWHGPFHPVSTTCIGHTFVQYNVDRRLLCSVLKVPRVDTHGTTATPRGVCQGYQGYILLSQFFFAKWIDTAFPKEDKRTT